MEKMGTMGLHKTLESFCYLGEFLKPNIQCPPLASFFSLHLLAEYIAGPSYLTLLGPIVNLSGRVS